MSGTGTLADALDRHWPRLGPCLVCGVPGEDQRHRVIDAIVERWRAGDSVNDLAADYGVSAEAVAVAVVWSAEEER